MISVNFKNSYNSGYGIAGTNIKNIILSRYPNTLENINLKNGINIFVKIPPFDINKSAYNIGFFYWETIDFPKQWVSYILSLDEFWTSCDLITDNLKRIGFRGKIVKVPTPIVQTTTTETIDFMTDKKHGYNKDFLFYSIFQWHYRKGYDVLMKAFFQEFSEKEDVGLIIKTQSINKNFSREFSEAVRVAKKKSGLYRPKMFVSNSNIPYSEILKIHNTCDCFVLPHRGEGWGIPIHEALNNYKPVITTKFGGVTDYLNQDNAYIVDHSIAPVRNMGWSNLYDGKMWAEPDVDSLRLQMRKAFEKKREYFRKSILSKSISGEISYDKVSDIIISRLEEIL